jgi:membrane protein DedA with SNARE-associated domain
MLMHLNIGVLAAWIADLISSAGYGGLIVLMGLESACLPIPSELVMPFAGYLVSVGKLNFWLAVTAGALGCNLGSALAYEVGARGGRPALQRWGRYILLSQGEIDKVDRLFEQYGVVSALVGRLLPIVRTFIALPAGIARMNRLRFHIYTFIGSWLWCLALTYVGYQLGIHWNSNRAWHSVMHNLDVLAAGLLLIAICYFVVSRVRALRSP